MYGYDKAREAIRNLSMSMWVIAPLIKRCGAARAGQRLQRKNCCSEAGAGGYDGVGPVAKRKAGAAGAEAPAMPPASPHS